MIRAMSIYSLKPRFQALLRPAVARLARWGVSANQVTVAAALVSIALGLLLCLALRRDPGASRLFLLLPLWMFLRMACNAVDGMLAREFGQKSSLGAYLNELTDVVSDSILYLPFAFLPHFAPYFPALAVGAVIVLAVISEMTGTVAVMTGASRRYDGPMGKSDRAFVFGLLALAVGCGLPPAPWLAWLFPALAVLIAATIVNRVRRGLAELEIP
jgi:CDP-diacylglycerol--glycerol-3-phosphate 3-phosphatidyltransferase